MSSIQVSGQGRALPFTGFASLPFVVIGAALSLIGAALALVKAKRPDVRNRTY